VGESAEKSADRLAERTLSRVGRRGRNRGPAIAMLGFLGGLLCAALFIPSHPKTGFTASGAGGPAGGSQTALGGGAAAGSGPAASGLAGSGIGGSGAGVAGAAGSAGAFGASGSGGGLGASGPGNVVSALPPGGNGGATASGVTATAINLGIVGGDSTGITPACPRCGQGGQATDEALVTGLIAQWHKQGKLPVYGRDLAPLFQEANDLDATGASETSACQNVVAKKPFVALTGTGAGGADSCLAQQFRIPTLDASGGVAKADVQAAYPYLWEVGPSAETALANFAHWADQQGLLKGQVLGLFAPADGSTYGNIQEILNASFVVELKKLGYHLTVDYQWSGTGQSDDAVAVQKMKAAGVTVVFVTTGFTEPAGFQNQAEQIGYRPKYPAGGYASSSFTDSTADLAWNANAEDGNRLFATSWWGPWSSRSPATATGNQDVQDCLDAYESGSHTTLDVYNDDAKILYLLAECSDMEVILQAIRNAGPTLTQATFIRGIEAIRNMQTPMFWSVSFGPQKLEGSDDWQSAQFNRNKWQPSNDYINRFGNPQPWWVTY
jgi:hypothetical protein